MRDRTAAWLAIWLVPAGAAWGAGTPCAGLLPDLLRVAPAKVTQFAAASQTLSGTPACVVSLTIASDGVAADSAIRVAVAMPEGGWNHRFLGLGSGGLGTALETSRLALPLAQGYAAATTDMGTGAFCDAVRNGELVPDSTDCGDTVNPSPHGLHPHPYAIRDFGAAAIHWMTEAGRQLTAAFYGAAASRSYFHGCSTGGGSALMEAERFPADYDGILAGAPAYDSTHLHIAGAQYYQAANAACTGQGCYRWQTAASLALVHRTLIPYCRAHGDAGGWSGDSYLTQPASCDFEAKRLICPAPLAGHVPCTAKATYCTCLTAQQAGDLDLYWTGATDDRGRRLYPGPERGAESDLPGSHSMLLLQQKAPEPIYDSIDYWALGDYVPGRKPEPFLWTDLFARPSVPGPILSREIAAIDGASFHGIPFESVLNAVSTDLSAFKALGGKLILYQGYADPLIPTASSIDYVNAVNSADKDAADYLRLFLAPGVEHCNGGRGASSFGNENDTLPPSLTGRAKYDLLAALVAWRETPGARGPDSVIASHVTQHGSGYAIDFQRPLCAYPDYAAYVSGDPKAADSYKCAAGKPVTNQGFDPLYGP